VVIPETVQDLPTVLVVDDEGRSLEALQRILEDEFDVLTAGSAADAERVLDSRHVHLILCDQRMPDRPGIDFLKHVKLQWPEVIRMIISGYTDAHDVIDGINEAGIYQYITKPWHPENLVLILKNACRLHELQRQNELLAVELRMTPHAAEKVVTRRREHLRRAYEMDGGIVRATDSPMDAVCERLRQVAPYDVSVLLSGASGTGKELAARALHYGSRRCDKPFVVENCGALPDELLESELFGHRRGAFTGAVDEHVGLFERADGGTVFLDEIGEVSAAFQVKLLRVLQEGEFRPLGGARTRKVNIRVIAATNKDLEEEVRHKRFRADLFYRLSGMIIHLPPLRERKGDLPILAAALLARATAALGKTAAGITPEALEQMRAYDWPGNIRELHNEIQRMLVRAQEGGLLHAGLLSSHIRSAAPPATQAGEIHGISGMRGSLKERVEVLEARILRETLGRHGWNKSRAARELGLSRVGLRAKLERYGIETVEPLAGLPPAPGKH
jgi:two-component system, NtrC family, response regulator HupR/HoxA